MHCAGYRHQPLADAMIAKKCKCTWIQACGKGVARKAKSQRGRDDVVYQILPLLHLAIPAFDAIPFATNLDVQMNVVHAFCVLHKFVIAHAASVRSVRR
jgi:hypothetical protein